MLITSVNSSNGLNALLSQDFADLSEAAIDNHLSNYEPDDGNATDHDETGNCEDFAAGWFVTLRFDRAPSAFIQPSRETTQGCAAQQEDDACPEKLMPSRQAMSGRWLTHHCELTKKEPHARKNKPQANKAQGCPNPRKEGSLVREMVPSPIWWSRLYRHQLTQV